MAKGGAVGSPPLARCAPLGARLQATIGGRTAGAGLAAPRPYPVLAASIGHRWPAALLVRSRYVSAVRLTSQDRLAPGGPRDRCYRDPP